MTDDILEKLGKLSPLKRAAIALRKKQAELDAIKSARTMPIAIIGMGCRFPGADSPDAYWRLLRDGIDAITEVPRERWDIDAWFDPDPEAPGKIYAREGGFLSDIDQFDPGFFGISPREAVDMDPQQRLLLEVAWEALENAGRVPGELTNRAVGIFIGISQMEYGVLMASGRPEEISAYMGTGASLAYTAGRLSYVLGLQGPSLALDTACSSSLVALHLACQGLREGESELALAGGVNLNLSPETTVFLSRVQGLSPDGRCKTFDASADGFSRGEGCGIVVLKRLPDALADGDNVLAVIRGSAIIHDGPSSGFTVPNGLSQEKTIRRALERARVAPAQISYVETHGTGTSLGDPIEVGALGAIFAGNHSEDFPLTIGSVKTNFGHLESAAGMAGLMKAVLSLYHEEIPPHLHFKEPSPHIDWKNLPFRVPVARQPWPRGEARRIAGVSSFGMSGTNAHVVLEEAPAVPEQPPAIDTERPIHLLTLSAKSDKALRELAGNYAIWLEGHPEVPFADVCFTAYTGRTHFEQRLAVVAGSSGEAREQLLAGGYTTGKAGDEIPKTAFLFTGQGAQYVGMGRQLYETQPLFREILDRCDGILRPLHVPLLALLYGENADADALNQTVHTQPALFSLEYALAMLWQSWGCKPDAVMGHSVGEYVAACVAGVFGLEDGINLIAARGRLMQTLCEPGVMLALQTGEAAALEFIAPFAGALSLAAINGPESVVVSGEPGAMAALKGALAEKDIKAKPLPVSHAFHSAMMEPMLAEFEQVAGSLTYSRPKIPLCSNVTGQMATDEVTSPAYWTRHVREPVRFAAGVRALRAEGVGAFLEIGPKPALLGMARECLPDDADGAGMAWLPSLREGQDDWRQLLGSLGQWHTHGGTVDWQAFDKGHRRRKVQLPTYPFQRSRYWIDKARLARRADIDGSGHPLLGQKLNWADTDNKIRFESRIGFASASNYLVDHRIIDVAVVPGASHLETALAACANMTEGQDATSLQVTDAAFDHVLIIPDEEAVTVQTVLSPEAGGYHFQLFSLGKDSRWVSHAMGHLAAGLDEARPEPFDLARLRAQCGMEISASTHYQMLREHGINIEPGFWGVTQLFQGDNMALGRLELPESSMRQADEYRLHPILLDGGFQLFVGTSREGISGNETYVPIHLKGLRLYRPAGGSVWGLARITQGDGQNMVGDVSWLDDQGTVVAQVREVTFGRVGEETLRHHFRKQTNDLYEVLWRESRLDGKESTADETPGSWLLFADQGGMGRELAKQLEAAGNTCVMAYAGTTGAGSAVGAIHEPPLPNSTIYNLDPANPEDFHRLFRDALSPDAPPLSGIVHLWALDAPNTGELTDETLSEAQHLVCGSVLHLLQAAIGQNQSAKLWLVTRNAVSVGEGQPPLAVAQATLWGLGKTIVQEHPALWGAMIDDPEPAQLLAEIASGSGEGQVAYRDGKRYVARLVKSPIAPADGGAPLGPDGSYLITGGLGALGLEVARWMVDKGARYLVLTGRRAPSDSARETIGQLEAAGATVLVINADVSDREQVTRLLEGIDQQMPPLKGIIHAAGLLDDGVLLQQNIERLDTVMAPKVVGSWVLHTLTRDLPLEFFVCFSSWSSLMGSTAQGNYAAANAFLDALAYHRRAMGLPGLSINWGAWAGVGLAAELDEQYRARFAAMGMAGIEPERGVAILDELMGQAEGIQVGASPVNWTKFFEQFPEPPVFLSELVPDDSSTVPIKDRLAQAGEGEYEGILMGFIQERITGVLGMGPSQLDVSRPMSDMGLDSLMAVEMRNRIRSELDVEIPVARFVAEGTLLGLTREIKARLTGTAPGAAPESGTDPREQTGLSERAAIEMNADAVLEPAICPSSPRVNAPAMPHSILLTGATGFLGAYLLHELLTRTTADIHCLVRSENVDKATERLRNHLAFHKIPNADVGGRIRPVIGDLSQPLLGLSEAHFGQLADSVDVIYHNGAYVNHFTSYPPLKATNVLGAKEVLKLAVRGKEKPVHYTSTFTVLPLQSGSAGDTGFLESDFPDIREVIGHGYSQSKWVAEKLMIQARERGLPVNIYRPSRTMGHTKTGLSNPNDFASLAFKGCVQIGRIPEAGMPEENMVPVDYVARAIVHLSLQTQSLGKTFHLTNPRKTTWNELFERLLHSGYRLEWVPIEEWVGFFGEQQDNPLLPFLDFFRMSNLQDMRFDQKNTREGLAGSDIVCPEIDAGLIDRWISYWVETGFLDKPS
uniref:Thioester reductase domain-containing protein n=1 Tax=Candidatus Kentrum sp. DK TaxID=2126562 RepID=A0A450S0N2_9GAMM|nr:MAG: thioester reductase domain-containing protein [Candidatus Kentron sp. DK]